ncbi:MAG: hypothetical protein QW165_04240 [Candidatus Woesearchaeota archaeon]
MPWFRLPWYKLETYELFIGGMQQLKVRANWNFREKYCQLLLLSGSEVLEYARYDLKEGTMDVVGGEHLLYWVDHSYHCAGLPDDRKRELGELIATLIMQKEC